MATWISVGFRANLERYAGPALDGIVVLGSNGEYPLLDTSEKLRLIETAVRYHSMAVTPSWPAPALNRLEQRSP